MYSAVQYSTVQYSTVQYSTVQYSTVQYSTDKYVSLWQSNYVHMSMALRPLYRCRLLLLYQVQHIGISHCFFIDEIFCFRWILARRICLIVGLLYFYR